MVLPGPELSALEAATRLHGRPGRFLLSSGSNADGVGEWSFVGAEPVAMAHDLAGLDRLVSGLPDGEGPWPQVVGCLAYDLGRLLEPAAQAPRPPPDELGAPDVAFARHQAVWRRDERSGRCEIVGEAAAGRALHAALSRPGALREPTVGVLEGLEPEARHLDAVARVLEYLRAGDCYQVNVARWLRASVSAGDAVALLARLQARAPAPYGAVLPAGELELIAASPELFLRRAAGSPWVETRPIKGTIARGADDAERMARLSSDPKELAEHLMIVDLLRNDLGRLASVGSVSVEGFARVLTLPGVHHLVSTVRAAWPAVSPSQLLAATFPGGSITGAPKVRAMQIIDELEPRRRSLYTGCLGWFGAGGAFDLAITIRSLIRSQGALWLAVGGGIVADSTPAAELAETHAKAASWIRALG